MIVPPMSTLGLFLPCWKRVGWSSVWKKNIQNPHGFFHPCPLEIPVAFWNSRAHWGPIFGGTSLIFEPIHILHTFGCIQSLYTTLSARIISYKELGFAYAHDLKTKHPTITLLTNVDYIPWCPTNFPNDDSLKNRPKKRFWEVPSGNFTHK